MQFEEQVQAGIEVLDRIQPDWRTRVNLDLLRMYSPLHCIIGQIQESMSMVESWAFTEVLVAETGYLFSEAHGFTYNSETVLTGSLFVNGFIGLAEAWKQALGAEEVSA